MERRTLDWRGHRGARNRPAFRCPISNWKVVFRHSASARVGNPRHLFENPQSHLCLQRDLGWRGGACARTLRALAADDTHTCPDAARAQRGQSFGREVWRRIPSISREDVVLGGGGLSKTI